MRPDMSKVIVERPRVGGHGMRKRKLRGPRTGGFNEDSPSKESVKAHYRWESKELNENLEPLRRFLRKNIGRPWDKVYAEICENIRLTSATQFHVRQHVPDFVYITGVEMRGGKPYRTHGYSFYHDLAIESGYRAEFYVHPTNGLLCKAPKGRSKKSYLTRIKFPWIKGGPPTLQQHHQINGLWYLITLTPFTCKDRRDTTAITEAYFKDKFLNPDDKRLMDFDPMKRYGGYYYCSAKRQLSSAEIKKANLHDSHD